MRLLLLPRLSFTGEASCALCLEDGAADVFFKVPLDKPRVLVQSYQKTISVGVFLKKGYLTLCKNTLSVLIRVPPVPVPSVIALRTASEEDHRKPTHTL